MNIQKKKKNIFRCGEDKDLYGWGEGRRFKKVKNWSMYSALVYHHNYDRPLNCKKKQQSLVSICIRCKCRFSDSYKAAVES